MAPCLVPDRILNTMGDSGLPRLTLEHVEVAIEPTRWLLLGHAVRSKSGGFQASAAAAIARQADVNSAQERPKSRGDAGGLGTSGASSRRVADIPCSDRGWPPSLRLLNGGDRPATTANGACHTACRDYRCRQRG